MRDSSNISDEKELLKLRRFVNKIVQKNKQADLFNKAFLRPLQIVLKTQKTQDDPERYGSLPFGLKQVIKEDISDNQYKLADFQSFQEVDPKQKKSVSYIHTNNYDNLLSLVKKPFKTGIRLAICVCMYSQDKTMLRRTLAGIANNIATFVKNGFSPDQIGVFFVMDGIEVVDSTIVDFFAEMEKENFIYLDDDVEISKVRDLLEEEKHDFNEDVLNVNHYIFDQEEWKDRIKRKFSNRKKEYHDNKKLIKQIERLQKDKTTTFQDLNDACKQTFFGIAREIHKNDFAQDDEETKKHNQEFYYRQYAENISKSRPIISQALNQTKKQCYKYFQMRQNMALLNTFRYQVSLNDYGLNETQMRYRDSEEPTRDNLNQKKGQFQNVPDENRETQRTVKMNLFMITKYVNRGKLSSHNWFFNGFCKELRPQFAVLLDVGLAPEKDALYKMVKHMMDDNKVGGVCGYMGLRIQRLQDSEQLKSEQIDCVSSMFLKCVDIQRAQQMQYHFAHLVDKPFESIFSFIHVLPGAFSAYRMKAVQPDIEDDSELLKEYFRSIDDASKSKQIKESNFTTIQVIFKVILPDFMYYCFFANRSQKSQEQLLYNENVYLAEDRTLCMGIYQNGFTLKYLPDAYAWVDPMKNLHTLLGQRKRWINGSFFAFEKVRDCLSNTQSTNVALKIQMLYLTFMNMLAFVSPALFLFTIHVAMIAFTQDALVYLNNDVIPIFDGSFLNGFVYTIDFIYVLVFLGFIFYSMHLTNKNSRFVPFIYATSTLLGILSMVIFIILGVDLIRGLIPCEENKPCPQTSFLITNQDFVKAIGLDIILSLRYIILAMMGVYVIPIMIYVLMFCKGNFLVDIIFSTVSFLFYGPTYLNILNIYSLCRIDDISWGTKGLDTSESVSKDEKSRKQNWKKIKLIHVSKYVFWNIIMAFILMSLANDYTSRFILTYIIMVILAVTLFIKVFLGIIYLITYKCTNKNHPENEGPIDYISYIDEYFNGVKGSLYEQLNQRITEIGEECRQKKLNITNVVNKSLGSKIHFIGQKRALQRSKNRYQDKLENTLRQSKIKRSQFLSKSKIGGGLGGKKLEKVIILQEPKNEDLKSEKRQSFKKSKSILSSGHQKDKKQNKSRESKQSIDVKSIQSDSKGLISPVKKKEDSPFSIGFSSSKKQDQKKQPAKIEVDYSAQPVKKEKKFAKETNKLKSQQSSKVEQSGKKLKKLGSIQEAEEEEGSGVKRK